MSACKFCKREAVTRLMDGRGAYVCMKHKKQYDKNPDGSKVHAIVKYKSSLYKESSPGIKDYDKWLDKAIVENETEFSLTVGDVYQIKGGHQIEDIGGKQVILNSGQKIIIMNLHGNKVVRVLKMTAKIIQWLHTPTGKPPVGNEWQLTQIFTTDSTALEDLNRIGGLEKISV